MVRSRVLGVAIGLAVVITACSSSSPKSSSDKTSPRTTSGSPSETGTPDTSGSPGVTSGGGGGGGGVQLPVSDGVYPTGRLHIEFGGDEGGAIEIDGGGAIIGGFANIAFNDDNAKAAAIFAFGGGDPGGISLTYDNVTAVGTFGKECTLSVTGDKTQLKATFDCKNMNGLKNGATGVHIDAKGNFTLNAASS